MNHADSGLAHGTNGSPQLTLENGEAERIAQEIADEIEAEIVSSNDYLYSVTDSLRNHITKTESTTSRTGGIKGAHEKSSFNRAIQKFGGTIDSHIPSTQIFGVETVTYRLPKKDKSGKPTSEYGRAFTKTIYDPKIIDTETYLNRGIEAANRTASRTKCKLGREWRGIDNNGVEWHGYCDASGEIISVFPEY
ncbi:MAG: CdiA family toxin C-terminal domain-containing protein [Ruminococcus sp.]|nr:CdiA family toxin C-terminal domain-containing protein [Ruminococcus sp.]